MPSGGDARSLSETFRAESAGYGTIRYTEETMPEHASDLFALFQTAVAGIDSQFEFWLTITFALVVSTFFAGHVLTRGVRIMIASLYLVSIILVSLQLAFHHQQARYLVSLLVDIGLEVPPTQAVWADAVRILVFSMGSLAAIVFVVRPDLVRSDGGPTDSADD